MPEHLIQVGGNHQLATRLENLHRKSKDIVDERTVLDEKKQSNIDNRGGIKSIIDSFNDDSDIGLIGNFENALASESAVIEGKQKENNSTRLETLADTDEYLEHLEENLGKIQEMKRVTDLKSSEGDSIQSTQRRIGELQDIREILVGESLGSTSVDGAMADGYNADNLLERSSFLESLKINVEHAKYDYCLGVLSKGDLPPYYNTILSERHSMAEEKVRKVFDNYADKLEIKDANYSAEKVQHYMPNGVPGHPRGVYYNAIEDSNNPRGNGTTYFHELAHMIDHASTEFKSNLSNTEEFKSALIEDSKRILEAYKKCTDEQKKGFLISLRSNNRTHSFQDLLDATTNGTISIGWRHSRSYWERPGNLQAEAFAHFFEASMGAPDKLQLFQRYFPKSFAIFSNMIDNMQEKGYQKVLVRSR